MRAPKTSEEKKARIAANDTDRYDVAPYVLCMGLLNRMISHTASGMRRNVRKRTLAGELSVTPRPCTKKRMLGSGVDVQDADVLEIPCPPRRKPCRKEKTLKNGRLIIHGEEGKLNKAVRLLSISRVGSPYWTSRHCFDRHQA